MEQCQYDLIQILKSVICQDGSAVPSDADWDKVWQLARRNHLETAVYSAVPKEKRAAFQDSYYNMIVRSTRQGNLLEKIEQSLSEKKIHYGLQKGGVLKYDYPEVHLRFMSDMDLYIRPEDRAAIRIAMESIGGMFTGRESGDEQFLFPNGLNIEFHGRLLYRKTKHGIENYPDWSFVDENKNRLTEEGYALNLIGHAVYDLFMCGPGLRYILDLWVYRHRHQPQPDWAIVSERLRQDGIDKAAKNLLDLSEYLFSEGEETELMKELTEYVFAGGLHGDADRLTVTEAAKAGGKWHALLWQLFRNRAEFENRYPWLHRWPFLLPLAWILRIIDSLNRHKRILLEWRTSMGNVNHQEIIEQRERLKRFGL